METVQETLCMNDIFFVCDVHVGYKPTVHSGNSNAVMSLKILYSERIF